MTVGTRPSPHRLVACLGAGRSLSSDARECRVISNGACLAAQNARLELESHEDVIANVVFGPKREARCRLEAEPWVVRGMTEHHNGGEPELGACL
jgi:hypothetical protein